MATRPEQRPSSSSKPLHNFSFPCLKWGTQRFLRCVKLSPSEPSSSFDRRSSNPQNLFHNSKRKHKDAAEIDIEAVRQKLMVDLKVAAKKLKVSILEEGAAAAGDDETDPSNARPWNLRTRRAACKAPPHDEERKCNNNNNSSSSPMKVVEAPPVSKEKKNDKTKFSVSLSKEEIEEDFVAMVGTRPPRRPKKRPRVVQRQLDVRLL